jgi:transketolase C-terminal domain/subunit
MAIKISGTDVINNSRQLVNIDSFQGNFTATGNVTAYSDAKLKTNLKQIKNALDKVKQLTGYVYTRLDTGSVETGLIAQDVNKILPEAVNNSKEYLAIAYGNMLGLIIEAIKELEQEVQKLKEK